MEHSELVAALFHGRPDEPFQVLNLDNDDVTDLSSIVWLGEEPPPTFAEAEEWHQELLTAKTAQDAIDTAATDMMVSSRDDLVAQYQAGVTRLDAIVTNGPTYTQAQARDAIVDMAKIQRQMLKYIKSTVT